MSIKLIVGLGNPGNEYKDTRHNTGFWFVDKISEQFGISLSHDKKFHGDVGRGKIFGQDVRLLKPDTFMNRSGLAVVPLAKFYNIAPNEILIAHDELDIAPGSIRLKTGGGHGGHNGLRDILPHIGADFHRLRIGIGHPGHASKVSGWVLSKPSSDDGISIDKALDCALDNLNLIMAGDFDKARNAINGFKLS
ncbi:peptidyl-tRNA hydrolase [Moraxella bovoculi]|uniref:Peptidyl-tRNA hydrolase n=1 Tax=Moraxella bovoculi TaxID=386891 RepID=A0AAC8PUG5_9GAMM|nr:aminoacyl-tRNA hydrolase [Moraxella bovoculi]AKG07016.1 peptidyl-tRNA hydrolase [Moraxella bovoculi]AKG09004.1 peptidyl-tRNA hydrolase [Moraxella bovoculi]AKG10837.1 peptidyl-tRNA hydrolase [Moraxella bovoculi]AKG12874.1 peptidyl-tRNA hydrolase [Moraxella bovoculi]